jgi:hypothetical protein
LGFCTEAFVESEHRRARYEDDQGRQFTAGLFALTLNYLPKERLNPFVDVVVQSPERKDGPAGAILDS